MPFLPVNMRASGLRVYYGGQRGNRIGGLFKPVLTRVAIPVAKCVVVLLAESIKSNWQESDELCSKESRELDTEKKNTKKQTATQQRGSGLTKSRKLSKRDVFTITKKV